MPLYPALPIVIVEGSLKELERKKGVAPQLRDIDDPELIDVGENELVFDSANLRLVLRYSDTLLRFETTITELGEPGEWDFSNENNSHWIGVYF